MIERSVLTQKLFQLQYCLDRVQSIVADDPSRLDQLDVQEQFILNVQRSTQLVIDCASYIISDSKLGMPTTMRDYFSVLQTAGYLDLDLSESLKKMVGFRNIAVHNYEIIDVEILKIIYLKGIKDLLKFKAVILAKI